MNSCCIHTDQRSRLWMGSLKDTGFFLYMCSLRWRCLSPLFLWVLSVFVSLWMLSSSLPAQPTLTHPISLSPFVSLSLSLLPSLPDLQSYFLPLSSPCGTQRKTLRPGCSTDESSACLPMTVCFWFVCCRLKTETGNSKRSLSWLNRSCSKPSARPRLCLRWRPSSLRG